MTHRVVRLEELRASDASSVGAKAAKLGELAAEGFPVPPGFVVPAEACRAFFDGLGLAAELERLEGAAKRDLARHCSDLQRRILEAALPEPLASAILEAHGRLVADRGAELRCAVRSSATAEDLEGASFAGQHGTYYYVDGGHVLEMVKHCWASLFSPEAVAYRGTHGIPQASVSMAVVVQEMVPSEVSGVTFTANPVTGERGEIVIESSWGMGAAIVDGRVTPDRYVVDRGTLAVKERRIAEKRFLVPTQLADARAERLQPVPHELRRVESLHSDQVRMVAEWALRCETHFGAPQDVEWALLGGRFHLLQSRPITTLGRVEIGRGVEGKWVLFKALAENFTDPLTPLTEDLVFLFCPPGMRVIGGRAYANLAHLRPLVPFVLSDAELAELLFASGAPLVPLRLSLLRLPVALLAYCCSYLVLAMLFARTRGMPDDFMQGYRALCRQVDTDATLDLVGAMRRLFLLPGLLDPIGHQAIFVNISSLRFMPWLILLAGLLRRVPDLRPDTVALLCSGSEGVLSAEMGRGIFDLAHAASQDPPVREILVQHEPDAALARLREEPAARGFVKRLERFLAVHGHRGVREFELRSARWEEDPAPVIGMVRNYLLVESDLVALEAKAARARAETEEQVRNSVSALRWRLVRFAAGRARYYLKLRENSRFYHIMGFGAVRKKVLGIEAELRRQGRLKCKDDVFFLRLAEVAALREGRLGWIDVEDRIRERRLEHVRLAKATPPKTIGIELKERPAAEAAPADRLEGRSASPGRYAGIARVILDPSTDATLKPGEVLVAPYTDPAWTPLFLTAGAAVVEVGSYLSHAGTVAREFGMPCVVDVADCTGRIQTGTRVEVDGSGGVVRILGAGPLEPGAGAP